MLVTFSFFPAMAGEKKTYVTFKAGVYGPTGDLDDADYDTGLNGEVAFGHYIIPNLAFEAGIGHFSTEAEYPISYSDPTLVLRGEKKDEVTCIPLTITLKAVLPADRFELYLGGGFGLYFAELEGNVSATAVVDGVPHGITASFEDSDTPIGVHIIGGFTVDIYKSFFMGVEGKHIWTQEGKAQGAARLGVDEISGLIPLKIESNLNGYTVTGLIGFRF